MKNFVLVLVAVFALTTIIGCGKKKKAEDAVDINSVAGENVVSVTEPAQAPSVANAVPVVVENAAAVAPEPTAEAPSSATAENPSSKQIQQALKNAGFYSGKIDGTVGPKTKKAIEAFQSQNGLKADGKVGRKTWKALSGYLSKNAEVANPSAESQAVGQ